MSTEQLQAEVEQKQRALTDARNKLDRHLKREQLPALRKELVGTFWKYRNSYGIGEPRKWWIYRMVMDVVDLRHVKIFEFQTDCKGKFEAEICDWATVEGWTKITRKELVDAWIKSSTNLDAGYSVALGIAVERP